MNKVIVVHLYPELTLEPYLRIVLYPEVGKVAENHIHVKVLATS